MFSAQERILAKISVRGVSRIKMSSVGSQLRRTACAYVHLSVMAYGGNAGSTWLDICFVDVGADEIWNNHTCVTRSLELGDIDGLGKNARARVRGGMCE